MSRTDVCMHCRKRREQHHADGNCPLPNRPEAFDADHEFRLSRTRTRIADLEREVAELKDKCAKLKLSKEAYERDALSLLQISKAAADALEGAESALSTERAEHAKAREDADYWRKLSGLLESSDDWEVTRELDNGMQHVLWSPSQLKEAIDAALQPPTAPVAAKHNTPNDGDQRPDRP